VFFLWNTNFVALFAVDYIFNYVWSTEPFPSIFFEVSQVVFSALLPASPTSSPTPAPTPAPFTPAPTNTANLVIESVINYRLFFGIQPREPSDAEIASLLELTSLFYFDTLNQEYFNLDNVVASFVGSVYDPFSEFPIKIEFDLILNFDDGKKCLVDLGSTQRQSYSL
jgi:hypothetical protein